MSTTHIMSTTHLFKSPPSPLSYILGTCYLGPQQHKQEINHSSLDLRSLRSCMPGPLSTGVCKCRVFSVVIPRRSSDILLCGAGVPLCTMILRPQKRPLPPSDDNVSPDVYPSNVSRIDSSPASLPLHSPSTSLERLPTSLIQLIAQCLPPEERMSHLPRLSRSFPTLTSVAFQDDHIVLTGDLILNMRASARALELLSAVPTLSFDTPSVNARTAPLKLLSSFLHPSVSPIALHPPFMADLRECVIRLGGEDRCPMEAPSLSPVELRHLTLSHLVESLARCPLLSTLSVYVVTPSSESKADDSAVIDQLQTFQSFSQTPRATSTFVLILGGVRFDQQTLSLLLSLPLTHLDILRCQVTVNHDRLAVFPRSFTLQTLRTRWDGLPPPIFQTHSQGTEEACGLRHLEVFSSTEPDEEDEEDVAASLRSYPSLTAVKLSRRYQAEWHLDSLFLETVTNASTGEMSNECRLPHLQHLAYEESESDGEDDLDVELERSALFNCLSVYDPQLLTLQLTLNWNHSLTNVLDTVMSDCSQLKRLSVRLMKCWHEDLPETDIIRELPTV